MGFISPIPTDSRGNPIKTGSQQELGRNDFLQLLVTKLRYQDPLDPASDEDFVAQLAQFATLEQMEKISAGIESSTQWDFLQMQSINNMMAANLIGREVKADYRGLYLQSDGEVTINFSVDEYAEQVRFIITNGAGETVANFTRDSIGPGSHTVEWDGRDSRGNSVPEGYYAVEIVATDGSGQEFSPSMSMVGIVEAITYRDGGAYLRVNGSDIALGDISAVGEPGSLTEDDE
ncbi:MAG: flagellar hook assembly protein FlgD [candidate division Zixibacteria bacterium]|nr:flagellar hook assembly protein FlgD [candidate division Zixibacteria bacterium]